MISNRFCQPMYSTPHSFVTHEGRSNLMLNAMCKDVQVYHDYAHSSQLVEQMTIPLSADGQWIQVSEWLNQFTYHHGIPLLSAQYVNIWDPIEDSYTDISSLLFFSSNNLRASQLIYIRYAPNQENAVPPHASYQAMLEETQNYRINSGYSTSQKTDDPNNCNMNTDAIAGKKILKDSSILGMLTAGSKTPQQSAKIAVTLEALHHKQAQQNQLNDILKSVKIEESGISQAPQFSMKKEEENDDTRTCALVKPHSIRKMSNMSGQFQVKRKDSEHSEYAYEGQQKTKQQLAREKRVKERQISYVKEKVDEWRNLYEVGRQGSTGELERVNLDVAAQIVGLSRKTLDDYYAQLRKAQQFGFDFDSNSQEKMGSLRKFVKKMSESGISSLPEINDESLEQDNSNKKLRHFNTPQLKPTLSSDITRHDLSMSVGQKKNAARKYSENTYDMLRSSATTTTTFSALPLLKAEDIHPKQFSLSEDTMVPEIRHESALSNPERMEEEEEEDDHDDEQRFQVESQEDSLNYIDEGNHENLNKHDNDLL